MKEKTRQLARYGQPITGMTPAGARAMPRIVFRVLRADFGILGATSILVSAWRRGRTFIDENPALLEKLRAYSEHSAKELPLVVGLFFILVERVGDRRRAYNRILKRIIQEDAVYSMSDLYEVDELEKFEDPYEAFKEYNYGMFTCDEMKRSFPIDEFVDEGDHFHFRVQRCIQTELAREAGADELAEMGCDHDCFGYPLIEDRVNAVFRRPKTIAKGDDCCDFHFYRKGHEPPKTFDNK